MLNKFEMISDIVKKIGLIADAKGVVRCKLIWDAVQQLDALNKGLEKEDAETANRVEQLELHIRQLENKIHAMTANKEDQA